MEEFKKSKFSNNINQYKPFYVPEIERSKESLLLEDLIGTFGITKNILKFADSWLTSGILDGILRARILTTPFGTITIGNPVINKPVISYHVGSEIKNLTPKIARDRTLTYLSALHVDIFFKPNAKYAQSNPKFTKENVLFTELPTMLGSKFCHLYNTTNEELVEMGESLNDPLGYYIIKGTEKNVIIQERLRGQQFISFIDSKGIIEGRITCYSKTGSTKIEMTIGKVWPTIKVNLFHTKDKHIPLFVLFYFLGFNMNDAVNMILSYVKHEYVKIIYYALHASIASFNSRTDIITYWAKKRDLNLLNNNYIKTIIDDINRDLFPNIPAVESGFDNLPELEKFQKKYRKEVDPDFTPIQFQQIEKAKHLALMAARMAETMQGLRDFDDRDSWSNKETLTSHELYNQLFIQIYGGFMDYAQETINVKYNKYTNADFEKMKREITEEYALALLEPAKSSIREQFVSSYNSKSWGSKTSKRKENVTDTLKRETALGLQSQMTKINTPTSRQGILRKLRALQGTQMGRICIAETPEGENCGLVKNLALTTYVSMDRDTTDIIDLLQTLENKYISFKENDEKFKYIFLINGVIHCWAIKEVIRKIVEARRKMLLPIDCCIIYNNDNNSIEYSCNASRLCKPYLIVENGELVIDKKKLWGKELKILFESGAIEMVDIREEEHQEYYMAMFTDNVRNKRNKILELTEKEKNLIKINELSNDELEKMKYIYQTIADKSDLKDIIETITRIIDNNVDINKLSVFRAEHLEELNIRKSVDILVRFYTKELNRLDDLLEYFILFENLYEDIISELDIILELKKLKEEPEYTHSEIHPVSQYGISCGLMPAANQNQAARITYQGSMGKQAANRYHECDYMRTNDALIKELVNPTRSMWESEIARPVGFNNMPSGTTVNIAYIFDPYNMEDSTVWCKEFLESNLEIIKYTTYKTIVSSNSKMVEKLDRPIQNPNDTSNKYHALDENGLPIIGKYVKKGQYIIGKIRTIRENNNVENASFQLSVGQEGFIENVYIYPCEGIKLCVKVRLGVLRKQIVGDKLASRYSQKGTISKILPRRLMPRVSTGPNKGMVPDVLISPASTISRMTQGKPHEILCSKGALYLKERINATTYNRVNVERYMRALEENGLNKYGNEIMCHPNGKLLECEVFFGPCTYQALRHHVKDKIQLRARGPIKSISQQPTSGRDKEGGLRLGEMERDAFIEHGGSAVLNERLMRVSDMTRNIFCSNCGNLANYNKNSMLENKLSCNFCKPNVAKFGTVTFSRIYLLILRMLQSMGMNCVYELKDAVSSISHPMEIYLH